MKTFLFLVIVLVSGFSAGIIHGFVNLGVVEPFLDKAIGIENQNLFTSGEAQDTPQFWEEFNTYRIWQKQGQILAGGILGLSLGALFGLVFAYSRHVLPGQNHVKKALVLVGIMWFTLFFIPFLKYPANPPTVGDPNTIVFRALSYDVFIAPMDLVNGFRIVSAVTVTISWIVNGIILGLLWQKFQPHVERQHELK